MITKVHHSIMSAPNPTHHSIKARVLATRPEDQNSQWRQILQQHHFDAIDLPLLAINPISEPHKKRQLKTCMLNVDQYRTLIFVSQNAVKYFFEQFDYYWPQLIEGWRLIGVGSATEQAIKDACNKLGGAHGLHILGGKNAMNSEALLAMDALQHVSDEKILICRGVGGRTRIGETLISRKARIDYCELYQRDLPTQAASKLANIHFDTQNDCLIFFSGETLAHFVKACHTPKKYEHTRVIVPSARVAKMATAEGFKRVKVANNATSDAMLATLLTCYP